MCVMVVSVKYKKIDVTIWQSGRSPTVEALFSATNFNSYIIELLQLHITIQMKWNHAQTHHLSHAASKQIIVEKTNFFVLLRDKCY